MLALSQMTDFDKSTSSSSSSSSCSSSSSLTPLLNNPTSNAMPLLDNARPWIPALQHPYTAGYYPSFQQQQQQQQQEYYNCPFTAPQWAELEQQALIFRYMMARAPIPAELVNPIRRRLLSGPQNLLAGFHPGLGYSPLDLEPGRCRRTDGKKWRCSRPVVPEQKYCERHVNRGRNRSKKAKEAAAAAAAAAATAAKKPSTPEHGSLKLVSQHQLLFQSSSNDQSRFPEHSDRTASTKPTTSPLRQFFDDERRPTTKSADNASSPLDLSLFDATTRIGLASSQPSPASLPDDDDKRHLASGAANSPTAVLQRAACTSDCSSSGGSSSAASASVK